MSKYRVTFKKTGSYKKYAMNDRRGRVLRRYLQSYIDESGKALAKSAENPLRLVHSKTEAVWLLPQEKTGKLYTGGFFGIKESPGNDTPAEQKEWIKNFTEGWVQWIASKTSRRTDGVRFVLSMGPESVAQLTRAEKSVDQSLREIWRETTSLYRKKHGWTSKKDDIAWIGGVHHDTDNTHMHIILFPTTKSGKIIRTHNQHRVKTKDGKVKMVNDLNDMIAMSNISAENWWRNNLPLNFQNPEYKLLVAENPSGETPPLPTLEEFEIASGLKGFKLESETPEKPNETDVPFKESILTEKEKHELAIQYGKKTFLDVAREFVKKTLNGKAINALRALAVVINLWKDKKTNYPKIFVMQEKKDNLALKTALIADFPLEADALKRLAAIKPLLRSSKAKAILADIEKETGDYGNHLHAFILGNAKDESTEECLRTARTNIKTYENMKEDPESLKALWNQGTRMGKESKREKTRLQKYQILLRSIKAAERTHKKDFEDAKSLTTNLIRGSERIALVNEHRQKEFKTAIKKTRDGFEPRIVDREWSYDTTENNLVPNPSKGKPWADWSDPETCLEPLKNQIEIPKIPKSKVAQIQTKKEKPPEQTESPVEIMIRMKRKSDRERKQAIERSISTEIAETMDGPEIDLT